MEASAYFMRNGLHYLITSGTMGYHSNLSEASVAKDWHGPYEIQVAPHAEDKSRSFNSQITSVFRHPGKKDLYIVLADRWIPKSSKTEEAFYTGEVYVRIHKKFRISLIRP